MRNRKHGMWLILLGLAQVGLALRAPAPFHWLLAWSGLGWGLAGGAYAFVGPRAFGKGADGGMSGWSVAFLLPYLAANRALWWLQTRLSREACYAQVAPGLWLGRRCSAGELPPETRMVVDLTAEFEEPQSVREGRTYVCVPTLDASAPSLEAFDALVGCIARCEEPVYIHCALGHGRSATVMVAVIAAKGAAASLKEAERMVRTARPGVKLNRAQREVLKRWAEKKDQARGMRHEA